MTDYEYHNRGNLKKGEDGKQIHGYVYGAMNQIAELWNDMEQKAFCQYNSLGQRTGKNVNGSKENYLIDLMKPTICIIVKYRIQV